MKSFKKSITGQTFGRLFVRSDQACRKLPSGKIKRMCDCVCKCGKQVLVSWGELTNGNTQSCGCLNRDIVKTVNKTHGHTCNGKTSGAYSSWCAMIARCTNPKSKYWYRYGGNGIKVCERWLASFEDFFADMGERPKGKTIGRKDHSLGYFPENCEWQTWLEQARQSSHNHVMTVRGVTGCMTELCEKFGVPYGRVQGRIQRGWTPEQAFFEPRYTHV